MKTRVLVVEDNHIAATAQKCLLLKLNCEVDCVDSGEEAIQVASENKYDLILMDIGLPGIDGVETTEKIRGANTEVNNCQTPIVAVTANNNPDKYKKYLAAGMDEAYSKPFTPVKAKEILARFCTVSVKST